MWITGYPDQPIRDVDEAVNRMRSAVNAAKGRIVVTGRTDNFIQGRPDLDDTIRRVRETCGALVRLIRRHARNATVSVAREYGPFT
ncbi:hypothetical protein [Streptomyces sp. NBC_01643]|uniref:hypothetical protein n=1 Tax=Streptomyces sp. NBC_01643 TaxID=2975906 RepID=UPI0038644E71|nr:hypothetical protein OHB03_07010 [Streptomyces sp. NBC_01643]